MNNIQRQIGMGLICGLCFLLFAGGVNGQILNGIKKSTDKVTKPMKDVQSKTKSATQPIKDTRRGVKEVTDAPRNVSREVKSTKDEVKRAGNEVKRAGDDVKQAKDQVSGNKSRNKDDKDSTKTGDAQTDSGSGTGSGKTVVIDERTDRDPVGGSNSGSGKDADPATATTNPRTGNSMDRSAGDSGAAPTETEKEPASTGTSSRTVAIPPHVGKQPPKPDRSDRPGGWAYERADFDVETLEELFDHGDWEGVGRDHTLRAAGYTLKQLKSDIDEIRQADPDPQVADYELKYRDWYQEYKRRSEPAADE